LRGGLSKAELLEELVEEYYDREALVHLVASAPAPELRDKYAFLNRTFDCQHGCVGHACVGK